MSAIAIKGLSKRKEGRPVLRDLSLEVAAGQTHVVCYPSESSEAVSVLLDCLSGAVRSGAGQVLVDGKSVGDGGQAVGVVNGERLEAPITAINYLRSWLRETGVPMGKRKARAIELLEAVELGSSAQTKVRDLSTEATLRLGLAHAMLRGHSTVCVDAGHDADKGLAESVFDLAEAIKKACGWTLVCLTTDVSLCLAKAPSLSLFHEGRLLQTGSPLALYRRPATVTAARQLGRVNVLAGKVTHAMAGEAIVATELGEWHGSVVGDLDLAAGQSVAIVTRPEGWHLERYPAEENCLSVHVSATEYLGERAYHTCVCDGHTLTVLEVAPKTASVANEDTLYCWAAPEDVLILPPENDDAT